MASPTRSIRIFPIEALQSLSAPLSNARQFRTLTVLAIRALTSDLFGGSNASQRLMVKHAQTFSFATRFLPAEYRDSTINLYAFFRTLDDLVDESGRDSGSILAIELELDRWSDWFDKGLAGPAPLEVTGRELKEICLKYLIPPRLFRDFLDGMRSDLHPITPDTREEIERYSYRVASTVGVAMTHVFGVTTVQAIEAATRLGIAMQLTNFLRDVGGDVERGRVYLPVDLLNKHGLGPEDVVSIWMRTSGPYVRLRNAMKEVVDWADEYYQDGIDGIRLLPSDVRMPIMAAARLYQRILRQLEKNQYDSLRARAATNRWQKLSESYRCAMTVTQLGDDPARIAASQAQAHARKQSG